MEVLTSDEPKWVYGLPENPSAKMLLLTRAGIACIGSWQYSYGMIAYSPLPKRDKAKEENLSDDDYHIGE